MRSCGRQSKAFDKSIKIAAIYLFKCIDVSIFPDKLKTAQVRPLFKKKKILEKGNYRPVSVLPNDIKIC
jgi:hypothetical protein